MKRWMTITAGVVLAAVVLAVWAAGRWGHPVHRPAIEASGRIG